MFTRKSNFLSIDRTWGHKNQSDKAVHCCSRRLSITAHLFLHLPQTSHHTWILRKLFIGCFETVFICNWRSSADYLIHPAHQEIEPTIKTTGFPFFHFLGLFLHTNTFSLSHTHGSSCFSVPSSETIWIILILEIYSCFYVSVHATWC